MPTLIFQPPLKDFTRADPSEGENPAASITLSILSAVTRTRTGEREDTIAWYRTHHIKHQAQMIS